MIACVYEDSGWQNLWPLTATRPVYDLFLGTSTLLEKIAPHFDEVYLFCRPYLRDVVKERHPDYKVNELPDRDEVVFVNGRAVFSRDSLHQLDELVRGEALVSGNEVVAAKTKTLYVAEQLFDTFTGGETTGKLSSLTTKHLQSKIPVVNHLWDLISLNSSLIAIESGGEVFDGDGVRGRVFCQGDVNFEESVYVDGRAGPVVFGKDVVIEAFSKVVGPCYVGAGSRIFSGAVVARSSFGPVCRIGGEVEESIFFGYSNKRHYGFLGHSVVGEWVNIGAGTTVSNLKNTYGTIKVNVQGQRIDTGRQFLGAFFADHVKTSIGCMVTGGVKAGVSSHLYRNVLRDVPSFTIYTPQEMVELDVESALTTAERMMSRRKHTPSASYRVMLRNLFESTAEERRLAGVSKKKFTFYKAEDDLRHG